MGSLDITVRYRPVKVGWCISSADRNAFRSAVKLSHTFWGGRYNPVIPVDNPELAKQLIALCRVDVLWALTDDPEIRTFVDSYKHLQSPFFHSELFVDRGNGKKSPICLDIFHPIRKLYEEHFRNNSSPSLAINIFNWDEKDPLRDVMECTYGSLPDKEITGVDYLDILRADLKATDVTIQNGDVLPWSPRDKLTLSTLGVVHLKAHYTHRGWGPPGIYVGDADNIEDLINFWNLRACGRQLVFYDPAHRERFGLRTGEWIADLNNRPKPRHRLDGAILLCSRSELKQSERVQFGDNTVQSIIGDASWNGLNVKCSYMYFGETQSLANIGQNSAGKTEITFALTGKPFDYERASYDESMIAAISPGIGLFQNELETLHTPFIPELNEYYGRECHFRSGHARAEVDALGIIISATEHHLSLTALGVSDLIRKIFELAKINATPSKPGLIASRLIQQMGGLQGCRVFKIAGVRQLIEGHTPYQHFTRGAATKTIFGDAENGTLESYTDLHIRGKGLRSGLNSQAIFDDLLNRSVFRAGLRFDCPSCQLEFWIALDDVRSKTTCEYCGHNFNVTPQLRDRDWAYRRSGLFGREDHQEGAIPVALVLMQLHTMFVGREFSYATATSLSGAAIRPCETDFVALHNRGETIEVVIGECKTRKAITAEDVENMQRVAEALATNRIVPYLLFAKLGQFTSEELDLLRPINTEFSERLILLSGAELERYRPYYGARDAAGHKISVGDFAGMVRATKQLFLT